MAELIIPDDGNSNIRTVPAHTVWTKKFWSAEWEEREHLYADSISWTTAPQMPSAGLTWTYGDEIKPGETSFQEYEKFDDLIDQYVKIKVDEEDAYWYGVITKVIDKRAGAILREQAGGQAPVRVLTGTQGFRALGLEHLLRRAFMQTSWVREPDGNEKEYFQPFIFNDRNDFANNGNRNPTVGVHGEPLFADDYDTAVPWTTRNIVGYLFNYHPPSDALGLGLGSIDWKITAETNDALPSWDKPVIRPEGKSLWTLMNQLCDPRRNMSWWLKPEDQVSPRSLKIFIEVFNFNENALTLPSGAIQQPNSDQITIDADRAVDLSTTVTDIEENKVEQVVVRGARKRSVVSLANSQVRLIKDWQTADEEEYEQCTTVSPGSFDDSALLEERVKNYRANEQFERVYSYYKLSVNWEGQVDDGVGGSLIKAFPQNEEGDEETIFYPGLRFEKYFPALARTLNADDTPTPRWRPFGIIELDNIDAGDTSTDRFQYLDRIAVTSEVEIAGDGEGRKFSCSLRMRDDAPGVIIRVSGAPQHAIALTSFDSSQIDEEWNTAGLLEWEFIIITVMIEADARHEKKFPATANLGQVLDVARILFIDLPDEKSRLDFITTKTVIGITDGELTYPDSADFDSAGASWFYLQNDGDYMADLAQFAFEWYGSTRKALSMMSRQLTSSYWLGQLITEIGEGDTAEEVNSVVTGVRFNMLNATTQITTSFPNLDFKQL